MKRTMERILFMMIGASIAFTSYLIGNVDKNADAQNRHIECDTLMVRDWIMVSGADGAGITLNDNQGNPSISLFTNYVHDLIQDANYITVMVDDDQKANIIRSHRKNSTGFELNATAVQSLLYLYYGKDRLEPDNDMKIIAAKDTAGTLVNDVVAYKKPNSNASSRKVSLLDPIVVEVIEKQIGLIGNDIFILSADVKLPSGQKIHVKFDNPQTTGMFTSRDKIRIKHKEGNKWEFIEHVP